MSKVILINTTPGAGLRMTAASTHHRLYNQVEKQRIVPGPELNRGRGSIVEADSAPGIVEIRPNGAVQAAGLR